MSDIAPGPGWWKASDGNWYPPQSAPGAAPPPPPPPMAPPAKSGKGCLIAVLIVFGLVAILAVGSIVAITFLGHKATDKLSQVGDALQTPSTVDPAHPDARSDDHVLELGDSVDISGFTATVRSAELTATVDGLPTGNYLVVEASVENRDSKPQTPLGVAWNVQQPSGLVTPPATMEGVLNRTIGARSTVSGRIVFQVSEDTGTYFVLYRPDPIDRARGVWPVSR